MATHLIQCRKRSHKSMPSSKRRKISCRTYDFQTFALELMSVHPGEYVSLGVGLGRQSESVSDIHRHIRSAQTQAVVDG